MIQHAAEFYMPISNNLVIGLDSFQPTCDKDYLNL